MAKTKRIEELLRALEKRGYLTDEEFKEAWEITLMSFKFEIDGDWDDKSQAYDKPKPKFVMLDDSEPGPVEKIGDGGLEKNGERGEFITNTDIRIAQLEAVTQELMRKLKTLEERIIDPKT